MSRSETKFFRVDVTNAACHVAQFNMLVSYTYRSDDPAPSESNDGDGPSTKPPEIKTFAFYTVVDLGQIIPREDPKPETEL